jgi:hypothetical protein
MADKQFGKGRWSIGQMGAMRTGWASAPARGCEPRVEDGIAPTGYELALLPSFEGDRWHTSAINSQGSVVGHCRAGSGPPMAFAWRAGASGAFLGAAPTRGQGNSIDDAGVIVGAYFQPSPPGDRPCLWQPDGSIWELSGEGCFGGRASLINRSGMAIGYQYNHPTEWTPESARAVCWDPDAERTHHVCSLSASQAVDANSAGEILVITRAENRVKGWLWHRDGIIDLGYPDSHYQKFFPTFITEDRVVIGTAIDHDNTSRSFKRHPDGAWELLARTPTCGNQSMLAGHEKVGGYSVPWIWLASEEAPRSLPRYSGHHTMPTAINSTGSIVGIATTDTCSHPIIWRPSL